MTNQLPKVKIDGKVFYKDERLREYRQVTNPQNRISFDETGNRIVEPIEQTILKTRQTKLR